MYQLAFDATFSAHNAYDDSKALADILMRSEYTVQLIEDVKLSCKPLSSFHQKQAQEKVTNSNISELRKLVKNGNVANKLGKLGFSCELLKDMWKKFGEEKCLPYFCTCNPRSKYPRVSKDVKDLIVIAKALRG